MVELYKATYTLYEVIGDDVDDIATYNTRDEAARARRLYLERNPSLKNRDEAPSTDGLGREELEREALWRVSATNYYDLADNIDATSDDELRHIIAANGNEAKEARA